MRSLKAFGAAAVIMILSAVPTTAKFGLGVHWGFDYSLSMDGVSNERAVFDDIQLDLDAVSGTNPFADSEWTTIPGRWIPLYINRTPLERNVVNFGGKIYIDFLRIIDAVEISTNFGVWEYRGEIKYPVSLEFNGTAAPASVSDPADLYTVVYDSLALTLDRFPALGFMGLDMTPYAKLHFDATIRKFLFQIPKSLKTLSLYMGGGVSLHFATPALSAALIEDVLQEQLGEPFENVSALGPQLLGNTEIMQAVLEKMIEVFTVPRFGMHLVAGLMLKLPVLPIAFYGDCKLQIPFGYMDDYVEVKGVGFLFNTGIALHF